MDLGVCFGMGCAMKGVNIEHTIIYLWHKTTVNALRRLYAIVGCVQCTRLLIVMVRAGSS